MSTESIVSFASLILADAGAEITAESILNVIKAAGATVDGVCTNEKWNNNNGENYIII